MIGTLKNMVAGVDQTIVDWLQITVPLSVPQSIDNCVQKFPACYLQFYHLSHGDTVLTWYFTDAAGNTDFASNGDSKR